MWHVRPFELRDEIAYVVQVSLVGVVLVWSLRYRFYRDESGVGGVSIVKVWRYGEPWWRWFAGEGVGGFVSFVAELFAVVYHGNYELVNEAN